MKKPGSINEDASSERKDDITKHSYTYLVTEN